MALDLQCCHIYKVILYTYPLGQGLRIDSVALMNRYANTIHSKYTFANFYRSTDFVQDKYICCFYKSLEVYNELSRNTRRCYFETKQLGCNMYSKCQCFAYSEAPSPCTGHIGTGNRCNRNRHSN